MSEPKPFDVTAIAVDRYEHVADQLDGVLEDAAEITRLLGELGGVPSGNPLTAVWDEASVKAGLRSWVSREAASSVLLWLGHGESDGDEAALACYDSPEPIFANGLNAQVMASQVYQDWVTREERDPAWALVIIEACGSGHYVELVHTLLARRAPKRLCLIGVSGNGASYVGQLRQAVERAIQRLRLDERVTVQNLVAELSDSLSDLVVISRLDRRIELAHTPPIAGVFSAPLDVYTELMTLLEAVPEQERLFLSRFQAAEQVETIIHFVGRTDESTKIFEWLRTADRGLLVVTGRPGSGKSALLGNVLIRSSPSWGSAQTGAGWLSPEAISAPGDEETFDTALHLSGLSTAAVVSSLAKSLCVDLPTRNDSWSGGDIDLLVRGLVGRRFTVLVDGLDEAIDPIAVASTVLRRLADLPHGRVVVGSRASTFDQIDGEDPSSGRVGCGVLASTGTCRRRCVRTRSK